MSNTLYFYGVILIFVLIGAWSLYKYGRVIERRNIEQEREDHDLVMDQLTTQLEKHVKSRTDSELDDLI